VRIEITCSTPCFPCAHPTMIGTPCFT
jgi:hypothetical protein